MSALLVAVVVLPAVVGAALLVAAPARRVSAPAPAPAPVLVPVLVPVLASMLTAALVAAASIPVAVVEARASTSYLAGAELGLAATGPARVLLPLLAVVTLLVVVAATGLQETRGAPAVRFHGFVQLFLAAAALTVLATSLPALLLGWEVMGATSAALIALHWRDLRHGGSGATAFLTTRTADLGLYVAAGAALAGGAGLALDDLAAASPGWRHVVAAGVLVAAMGKAAQLPFSFWLDRAMDGPAPVSALLHSAAMVALGGYLALRVAPLLRATGWADDAAAWAGAATAIVLGAVALAQTDLKRALGASTAAQLGFVLAAAGVAGGVAAGTAHLVGHAGVKAALFLAAGVWLQVLGTRDLGELAGAIRRSRLLGAAVTLALLALAGLPPLALWATKDLVLAGALEHSHAVYAALLVAAALSSAYAVRLLVLLLGPASQRTAGGGSAVTTAVVAVLASVGLVGGLLALPAVTARLAELVSAEVVEPSVVELLVSAVIATAVAVLTAAAVRRTGARVPRAGRPLAAWLHLEAAAHRLVVRPTLAAGAALDRVDVRLDRFTLATATGTVRLATLVRRADVAGIDAAVRGVAAGARQAARAVLRPQTGQLHHYYLQVVVVLGVALVVLAVLGATTTLGSVR